MGTFDVSFTMDTSNDIDMKKLDSYDESTEDPFQPDDKNIKFNFLKTITSSPITHNGTPQSPRRPRSPRKCRYSLNLKVEDGADHRRPSSPLSLSRKLCSTPAAVMGLSTPSNGPPTSLALPCLRVSSLRLFDDDGKDSDVSLKSPYPRSANRRPVDLDSSERSGSGIYTKDDGRPIANVNPFSQEALKRIRKRTRSSSRNNNSLHSSVNSVNGSLQPMDDSELPGCGSFVDDDGEEENAQKRPKVSIHESHIPRYEKEFHQLEQIGVGEFGAVYKCVNRLDGCVYAIKSSKQQIAGSADEQRALNEVYAHAAIGCHPNIVRYYSAWAENSHLIIQNEYCRGGSLAAKIEKLRSENHPLPLFSEQELCRILLHVSRGLLCFHRAGLVHLDIKPGNIFISYEMDVVTIKALDSSDETYEDEQSLLDLEKGEITYKIGDFGHVTSIDAPKVEEGDCRYLPKELLNDDFSHLPKADIFSLGLTIYDAAGAGPLPKNGEDWHAYRDGNLPPLPCISPALNELIKSMVRPNPIDRPSASQLANHPLINAAVPTPMTPREVELRRRIVEQAQKTEYLERELKSVHQMAEKSKEQLRALKQDTLVDDNFNIQLFPDIKRTFGRTNRLVGRSAKRSMSNANF